MSEAKDINDLNVKTMLNVRYEGLDLDTAVVTPCPFCGEPGWMRARVLEIEAKMREGATCRSCGRGARAEFTKAAGATSFEIVQTGGPAPPAWFPKMRRVDDDASKTDPGPPVPPHGSGP